MRCSQFRFRNYVDFWQCGFVPDSIAFYTYKWLSIQGDWNPCAGPDSFQQLVAFYMYTYDPFSPRQFNRDVAIPNLKFMGEGASLGMSEEAKEKRLRENNRAWFTLMSHKVQEEANRRAMLNNAYIVANIHGGEAKNRIIDDKKNKRISVFDKNTGGIVESFPYKMSWLRINSINIWRALLLNYYCGGGKSVLSQNKFTGIRMLINAYSSNGAKILKIFETIYLALRSAWQK